MNKPLYAMTLKEVKDLCIDNCSDCSNCIFFVDRDNKTYCKLDQYYPADWSLENE